MNTACICSSSILCKHCGIRAGVTWMSGRFHCFQGLDQGSRQGFDS
jgi:hypothetical protein